MSTSCQHRVNIGIEIVNGMEIGSFSKVNLELEQEARRKINLSNVN